MCSLEGEVYSYIEEEEVEIPDIVEYEAEWGENVQLEMETNLTEESSTTNKVKMRKIVIDKKPKISTPTKFTATNLIEQNISNVDEDSKKYSQTLNAKSSESDSYEGNALFDGTFFSFVAEYYVENIFKKSLIRKLKAKCELCETPVYIIGTGSSTFNFLRHIRRKHGQKMYNSYLAYKRLKGPKPKNHIYIRTCNVSAVVGPVTIYTVVDFAWKQFGSPRAKRPLDSIILDEGVSDRILSDVHDFLLNPSWYHERGVPYRRTFLLHGPSGCGKSSFVFALAGELNYNLCVLYASDRELTDEKLNYLLNTTPENCIILLEDIDSAFPNKVKLEGHARVTSSGINHCLDGVTAPEGRILFITCTDTDMLDPMLLRPGRIDVREHFGFCSKNQIIRLYEKFFKESASSAVEFLQEVIKYEKPVTPAQLQGFFLYHKDGDIERLKLDAAQIWNC